MASDKNYALEILNDDIVVYAIKAAYDKCKIKNKICAIFIRNIVYTDIKFVLAGYGRDNAEVLTVNSLIDILEREDAIKLAKTIDSVTNIYMKELGICGGT